MRSGRLALLFLFAAAGCGEPGPPTGTVRGKLTIGGAAPPEPVFVSFANSTIGQGGGAVTEADGTYELPEPLRVAEYVVSLERVPDPAVAEPTNEQRQLTIVPKEYWSPQSSPLKKPVAEGENTIDLDVPKK